MTNYYDDYENGKLRVRCKSPKAKLNDPEFVMAFIDFVKKGNAISTVCKLTNISKSTYDKWRGKAREEKEPYFEFIQKVERADAVAESRMVRVITDSAEDGDVGSAKWFLKSKYPERWQERKQVNVGQDNEFKVVIADTNEIDNDERDKMDIES